jgi:hypothetical protein
MMLKGYFDDSGKADDPQHCAIVYAGYVGTTDAWTKFEPAWHAVLDEFHAPYLHMKEFAHSARGSPFENWKGQESKRREFLARLIEVIRSCELKHVGHVVNLNDLKRLNTEFSLQLKAAPLALYLCLLEIDAHYPGSCMELIIDKVEKPNVLVKKTRDIAENEGRINEIGANVEIQSLPKSASFKNVLPIQAADFIAWESLKFNRKRVIEGLESALPYRKSFAALMDISRERGGYWAYESLLSLHNARGGAWPATEKGAHEIAFRRLAKAVGGQK